ncbi:hypothetical protein Tco_0980859 [Tanacetum coccineum]
MGDVNPTRTLGDYSRPSHEGYRNTIELPEGNNVVPLRFDTIRLVQNGCSFHKLWSEDPNQHLKDFLKHVDSLDLDVANRERTRLLYDNKMVAVLKRQESQDSLVKGLCDQALNNARCLGLIFQIMLSLLEHRRNNSTSNWACKVTREGVNITVVTSTLSSNIALVKSNSTGGEHPTKDDACHHYKEVGHWKRNYLAYLVELIKKKQVALPSLHVSSQ